MDPTDNPYTPNAGAPPPALAGRDAHLDQFDVLLARLERGLSEQSMIVTDSLRSPSSRLPAADLDGVCNSRLCQAASGRAGSVTTMGLSVLARRAR